MALASLVDFMSQANGIAFYGSFASVGQHFTCYLEHTTGWIQTV